MPTQWLPGGLLGLPCERAIVAPIATPAPTKEPTRIRTERTRRCRAGARAAPAGLDVATPVIGSASAAAVPTGWWTTDGWEPPTGDSLLAGSEGEFAAAGMSGTGTAGADDGACGGGDAVLTGAEEPSPLSLGAATG